MDVSTWSPLRLGTTSPALCGVLVASQMGDMPAGGADTGVAQESSSHPAMIALGGGLVLAAAAGGSFMVGIDLQRRRVARRAVPSPPGNGGAGTLVLTHFSSRYDDVDVLAEQARAKAGSTIVVPAADLDRIPFPGRRSLDVW
ncbi:hypothetical protein [Arthrobacter sp. Br18]|uniref:hypothetical protein n=1 Tax=Arthrobacter sp. Br18 TaxID=1312954 RepID=UPI0020A69BDF|nr:hypothetical protein [Arthrobacter sp. Br18]